MASPQPGFYTAVTLLVLKILSIVFERYGSSSKSVERWRERLKAISGGMCFFVFMLGIVPFSHLSDQKPGIYEQCGDVDADIVGDGVRFATWVQEAILFLAALTGLFHTSPTSAKEVGGGLLIAHLSLTIALLVPKILGKLSLVDGILGSMILDAQNMALSIQLTAKETLAARWQVGLVLVGQIIGLVIVGVLVGSFHQDLLVAKDCKCFSVFWWVWFSNCSTVSPNGISAFWIYYVLRWIVFAHCSYISVESAGIFDRAKKREKEDPCGKCQNCQGDTRGCCCDCEICGQCGNCRKCNRRDGHPPGRGHPSPCQIGNCSRCRMCGRKMLDEADMIRGQKYSQVTATSSLMFLEYGAITLVSTIAAESTMSLYALHPSSPVYSVGQITALVIAGGTTIRAFWVHIFMFVEETRDDH